MHFLRIGTLDFVTPDFSIFIKFFPNLPNYSKDSPNAVIFPLDTAIIRVNSPVEKMHAQQRILY